MLTLDPCYYKGKWDNERSFVIGGGPSITDLNFDFKRLLYENVITVNQSYKLAPWGYIASIDSGFWGRNEKLLPDESRIFYPKDLEHFTSKDPRAVFTIRSEETGFPSSFSDRIPWKLNSGAYGILIAYLMGSNTIYLLGMDGSTLKGKSHHHSDYNWGLTEEQANGLCRSQLYVIKELKDRGVQVYSCSPISKLNDEIPYVDISQLSAR